MSENDQATLDVADDSPQNADPEGPAPNTENQEAQGEPVTEARDEPAASDPEPDPQPEPVPAGELDVMQPGWVSAGGTIELAELVAGQPGIVVSLGYEPAPLPEPVPVDLNQVEQRARLLAVGEEGKLQQRMEIAKYAMLMLTAVDIGFPPAWGLKNLYSFRDGQVPELTGSGWLSIIHRQPDTMLIWHERTPDAAEATGYRIGHQPYTVRVTYEDAVDAGWTKGKDGTGESSVWKRGLPSQDHLQYAVATRIGRRLLNDVVYAFGTEEVQYMEATSHVVAGPAAAVEAADVTQARREAQIKVRDELCNGSRDRARDLWQQVVTDDDDPDQIAGAFDAAKELLEAPL